MNKAIRVPRPQRGWICSICKARLSTRCGAEEHCPTKEEKENNNCPICELPYKKESGMNWCSCD